MAGLRGVGGMGGRERGKGGASGWSLPPSPYLSIHWGRNILDVQGRLPLAEGQRGFPLERARNGGVSGNRTGGICMGGPIHYGFCAGHSPSPILGRVEYVTVLEGSLSYSDTVSRSFWRSRIHQYVYRDLWNLEVFYGEPSSFWWNSVILNWQENVVFKINFTYPSTI